MIWGLFYSEKKLEKAGKGYYNVSGTEWSSLDQSDSCGKDEGIELGSGGFSKEKMISFSTDFLGKGMKEWELPKMV